MFLLPKNHMGGNFKEFLHPIKSKIFAMNKGSKKQKSKE